MTLFSSRQPNSDPRPYRHPEQPMRMGIYLPGQEEYGWVFDPRPEFDHKQHNPVNPSLEAFRWYSEKHGMNADNRANLAKAWLQSPRYYETRLGVVVRSKKEREHARRVLTRLARLAELSDVLCWSCQSDATRLTPTGEGRCSDCPDDYSQATDTPHPSDMSAEKEPPA